MFGYYTRGNCLLLVSNVFDISGKNYIFGKSLYNEPDVPEVLAEKNRFAPPK